MTRVLLVLIACLTASPVEAAIAYVNGTSGSDMTGASSTTQATSSFSVTTGNHVVVAARWLEGGTAPTVTGTGAQTFTQIPACSPTSNMGLDAMGLFYLENAVGSGTFVVTATWGSAVSFRSVVAVQHSGVATSSSYDTCSSAPDVTPSCTTGVFTTSTANQVLITSGQQTTVSQTWSSGGGATLRQVDASNVVGIQSQIVSSIQSGVTATMTSNGTGDDCNVIVATFKESTGAGNRRHNLLGLLP